MMNRQTFIELMQVERKSRDVHWLENSLQAAIEFIVSTLPLYLCALWSIKDVLSPVRKSLQIVILEEMLHLGWLCNLLTALGGRPRMKTAKAVPTYPLEVSDSPYPGKIYLQAFSQEVNAQFMRLEHTELFAPATSAQDLGGSFRSRFSEILAFFEKQQPILSEEKQLEVYFGPLALNLTKIATPKDAQRILQWMRLQGKSSLCGPNETGPEDLTHYYRFAEIQHGRKLRKISWDGGWEFSGDALVFPDVWPMAPVPEGGYRQEAVPDSSIWQLIEDFDHRYTGVLSQLEFAWQQGDSVQLHGAIRAIDSLQEPAVLLMQAPLPSRRGTYGPCFRLI